jgi:hypothetical protein
MIGAAARVQAQIAPPGRPQRPFPGAARGNLPNDADKKDDRDRIFDPANLPPPRVYVPTPLFRPEPTEFHVPPIEPSVKAPPVTEFRPPVSASGVAGKLVGGVVASIGAALAAAFRAIFGSPRTKDGEA